LKIVTRPAILRNGIVKKSEIGLNQVYEAKVAGKLAPVRILVAHVAGGWIGREVRIRSAARLRREIGWGRLDQIRRQREGGMTFEEARARVDRNEQDAADQTHDVMVRTQTEGELV
jgi:hypothetical protein